MSSALLRLAGGAVRPSNDEMHCSPLRAKLHAVFHRHNHAPAPRTAQMRLLCATSIDAGYLTNLAKRGSLCASICFRTGTAAGCNREKRSC